MTRPSLFSHVSCLGAHRVCRTIVLTSVLLGALAGCKAREDVLPGERYGLRDLDQAAELLAAEQDGITEAVRTRLENKVPNPPYAVEGDAQSISLGSARTVNAWPQRYLNANRSVPHLALNSGPLTRVWSVNFGAGNEQRQRITAAPVAAGGRLFVLDSLLSVSAIGNNGALIWQQSLVPPNDNAGEAIGGGLAVVDGRLYVTTGFGALHVLDALTGKEIWTQKFDSAVASAPLVDGDLVYVLSRGGFGYAIDRKTGRIIWEVEGTPKQATVLGAGAPAIAGKAVVFPFPSGELSAVLKRAGISLWTSSVSGSRLGRSYGGVNGIVGGPVVSGRTMYVATAAGRLAAVDVETGDRYWTSLEGAVGPVAVAGGSLFVVSDEARLLRVNTKDGSLIWAATLPLFQTDRINRRQDIFVHYGPVIAGGRVILVSNDGLMRHIDPASGQILRVTDLGDPAAAEPIIVGNTLYVITADGVLHAFR